MNPVPQHLGTAKTCGTDDQGIGLVLLLVALKGGHDVEGDVGNFILRQLVHLKHIQIRKHGPGQAKGIHIIGLDFIQQWIVQMHIIFQALHQNFQMGQEAFRQGKIPAEMIARFLIHALKRTENLLTQLIGRAIIFRPIPLLPLGNQMKGDIVDLAMGKINLGHQTDPMKDVFSYQNFLFIALWVQFDGRNLKTRFQPLDGEGNMDHQILNDKV